jgi:hypothetical protein
MTTANEGLSRSHDEEVKRMQKIVVRKLEDVRTSSTINSSCEQV